MTYTYKPIVHYVNNVNFLVSLNNYFNLHLSIHLMDVSGLGVRYFFAVIVVVVTMTRHGRVVHSCNMEQVYLVDLAVVLTRIWDTRNRIRTRTYSARTRTCVARTRTRTGLS